LLGRDPPHQLLARGKTNGVKVGWEVGDVEGEKNDCETRAKKERVQKTELRAFCKFAWEKGRDKKSNKSVSKPRQGGPWGNKKK